MSKRIVICPSFASSHHIKYHIPNMIEVLNPDVIIYNEGLFPQGPENRGHVDTEEFRKKWLYKASWGAYTTLGFDWATTVALADRYFEKVFFNGTDHTYLDADQSFLSSILKFSHIEPDTGDIIFPLEPDAFLYEGDIDVINEEISKLKPGEGLSCRWVDFLETQFYTEAINLIQPKYRRFCYCFDNMENYRKAMSGFTSQNYPALKKIDSFFIRHYCWFQPEPWKQLRYELIYRSDPNYWKDFDNGLNEIREYSERHKQTGMPSNFMPSVVVRPSRSDEGRYAKFIDVDHPKAIKEHPNFVR